MTILITNSLDRFNRWIMNAPSGCEYGTHPTKSGTNLYWITYDC